MKELKVGPHFVAKVDDDVFEWASKLKWYANRPPRGSSIYAVTQLKKNGRWRKSFLHKMITGTDGKTPVDHINRDGLDNQRINFRFATVSQNMANRRGWGKSSRFKGVRFHKRDKRWESRIQVNGKPMYIGRFDDEVQAALAYNSEATKHFGQFAVLNEVAA